MHPTRCSPRPNLPPLTFCTPFTNVVHYNVSSVLARNERAEKNPRLAFYVKTYFSNWWPKRLEDNYSPGYKIWSGLSGKVRITTIIGFIKGQSACLPAVLSNTSLPISSLVSMPMHASRATTIWSLIGGTMRNQATGRRRIQAWGLKKSETSCLHYGQR